MFQLVFTYSPFFELETVIGIALLGSDAVSYTGLSPGSGCSGLYAVQENSTHMTVTHTHTHTHTHN